jgi:hypothetical protein
MPLVMLTKAVFSSIAGMTEGVVMANWGGEGGSEIGKVTISKIEF